jgi:hypothetical protein
MAATDVVVMSKPPVVSVAIEPVQNALNSLLMIIKADDLLGLDEWVTRTAAAMTPERRHTHLLVFEGLHQALLPERRLPSRPAGRPTCWRAPRRTSGFSKRIAPAPRSTWRSSARHMRCWLTRRACVR